MEILSDESDGRTHHRINQYVIQDEIGRGSYGAVHIGTDQFGTEYVSFAGLRYQVMPCGAVKYIH